MRSCYYGPDDVRALTTSSGSKATETLHPGSSRKLTTENPALGPRGVDFSIGGRARSESEEDLARGTEGDGDKPG